MKNKCCSMKRLFKRSVYILLLAIFLFSAACSGSSRQEVSSTAVRPDETETIRICLDGILDAYLDQYKDGISEMLEELNKKTLEELNTKVELVWITKSGDSTYGSELINMLGSYDPPDAFMIGKSDAQLLYDKGLIMDITKEFPKYANGYLFDMIDLWGDEFEKRCRIDGKIYLIPGNDFYSPRYGVIAREDLVEKYMPEGISDIDGYGIFLNNISENEQGVIPGEADPYTFIDAYVTGNGYYSCFDFPLFGRWDDSGIDPVFLHDIHEFQTACEMYEELRENGSMTAEGSGSDADIRNGDIASMLVPINNITQLYGDFISTYKYRMYPLYLDSFYINSGISSDFLGIFSGSNKEDRVLMFIDWLYSSQENYDLLMYGIKGKHYELSGDVLDHSMNEAYGNAIVNWPGSKVFKNFLFERPKTYEPDDYVEFRKMCAFANTVMISDLYSSKGYDLDKYHDYMRAQGENILDIPVDILKEYMDYYVLLSQGAATDETLGEIIYDKGLQVEADEVLDYYEHCLEQSVE